MDASVLTVVLQVISFGLKWFGAKSDALAQFEKLVEQSHNDGLISVQSRDAFIAQKKALEAQNK